MGHEEGLPLHIPDVGLWGGAHLPLWAYPRLAECGQATLAKLALGHSVETCCGPIQDRQEWQS